MKIRLLPDAERDLEIGADFYESQSSGLYAVLDGRREPDHNAQTLRRRRLSKE